MLRNIDIDLQYQQVIPGPPPKEGDLYEKAKVGDKVTIESWRKIWIEQYQATVDRFGDLGEHSFGQLHGINRHQPAICIGSGPSLKRSIVDLQNNKKATSPVLTISALHNFGYLEDNDCHADFYLSLDAGEVVIDDVSESMKGDDYWAKTVDKKLIAYASSHPKLFDLWKGDIYLFNSLIPDVDMRKAVNDIQPFTHYISSGGNCLGACVYTAKAVFGSSTIMYVGADMCFDYDNTFHSYKTKYDTVGQYVVHCDIFGLPRKTWVSYLNFKYWFDHVAVTVPGIWVNCSEGLLGAYKEGNIRQYQYMSLGDALIPFVAADTMFLETKNKENDLVSREPFDLKEHWSNPRNELHLTFF